jgi:hypothetical protein
VSKSNGHKSIYRVDSEKTKTHGWIVRVHYEGQTQAKFFNDNLSPDPEKVLEMAIACRNKIEKELGKPRTDRVLASVSPRNRSGIVGIRRILKNTGGKAPDGSPNFSEVFEVTWQGSANVVKKTSVSIAKHGEKKAFQLACAIRKEKTEALYGRPIILKTEAVGIHTALLPPDAPRARRGRRPGSTKAVLAAARAAAAEAQAAQA